MTAVTLLLPTAPVVERGAASAAAGQAGAASLTGRVRSAWLLGGLVALVATLHVWSAPRQSIVGLPSDPSQYAWFLAWWPHALSHGLNPFFTRLADTPHGVNLMWNTSLLLAGLLLAPVTVLAGAVLSYNLLVLFCLTANVVAGFALARRMTRRGWLALAAGVCWGLSPFLAAHAVEHADFMLVVYPPLVLAWLWDAVTGRRTVRRSAVQIGLLTAAQLLYGEEIVAITAVGLALVIGWFSLRDRQWLRLRAPLFLRVGGGAALVALPVVAVPLGWQFFGPQRIRPPLYPPDRFSTDVLNLVLPTTAMRLNDGDLSTRVGVWSGGVVEASGFLLPLVGLLLLTRRRWAHNRVARMSAWIGGIAALLSLGPDLHVGGHLTGIPGPDWVLAHLPVVKQILPARFTLISWLAGLVILLIAADSFRPPSRRTFVVAPVLAALAVALVPSWPMPVYLTDRPAGLSVIRPGDVVEFAPTVTPGLAGFPMLWQAQAGFAWSMHTSYLVSPQSETQVHGGHSDLPCLDIPIALKMYRHPPPPTVACTASLIPELRHAQVTVLVAAPSAWQGLMARRIAQWLGPPHWVGNIAYWRLAPPHRLG
jgi:hypothetical protein